MTPLPRYQPPIVIATNGEIFQGKLAAAQAGAKKSAEPMMPNATAAAPTSQLDRVDTRSFSFIRSLRMLISSAGRDFLPLVASPGRIRSALRPFTRRSAPLRQNDH